MRHSLLLLILLIGFWKQAISQIDSVTYSFTVKGDVFNGHYLRYSKKQNSTISFYRNGLSIDYMIQYIRGELVSCVYYKNGLPWTLIEQNDSLIPIKNPNPLKNGNGILIEVDYQQDEWDYWNEQADTGITYIITSYKKGLKYGPSFTISTDIANINVQGTPMLNYCYYKTDTFKTDTTIISNYSQSGTTRLSKIIHVASNPLLTVDVSFVSGVSYFNEKGEQIDLYSFWTEDMPPPLLSLIKVLRTKREMNKINLTKIMRQLTKHSLKTIKYGRGRFGTTSTMIP